jgi:hypothetical protein
MEMAESLHYCLHRYEAADKHCFVSICIVFSELKWHLLILIQMKF